MSSAERLGYSDIIDENIKHEMGAEIVVITVKSFEAIYKLIRLLHRRTYGAGLVCLG